MCINNNCNRVKGYTSIHFAQMFLKISYLFNKAPVYQEDSPKQFKIHSCLAENSLIKRKEEAHIKNSESLPQYKARAMDVYEERSQVDIRICVKSTFF